MDKNLTRLLGYGDEAKSVILNHVAKNDCGCEAVVARLVEAIAALENRIVDLENPDSSDPQVSYARGVVASEARGTSFRIV